MGKNFFFISDQSEFFSVNLVTNLRTITNDYLFTSIDFRYSNQRTIWNEVIEMSGNKIVNFFKLCIHLLKYKGTLIINYVNPIWVLLIPVMKNNRLILTFFGSDYYKVSKFNKFFLSLLCFRAQKIVFTSKKLLSDFRLPYRCDLSVIYYGNDIIPLIKINNNNRNSFLSVSNKLNITIGYNGSIYQRHIEVLNLINKLDVNIKNSINLLFPFQYGANYEYRQKIEEIVNSIGVDYIFYDEFMSSDEIAIIRSKSDIFIHNQSSDNLSASLVEYLAAGNIVLTSSDINYSELIESGFVFRYFYSYEDLFKQLIKIIENFNDYSEMRTNNSNITGFFPSWIDSAKEWFEVLDNEK